MISYGPIGKIIRAVLTVSLASSIIGCTNAGTVAVQSSRTPVIETPTSTPFYPSTQEIKSPVHTPEISATSEPTSFMFLDSGQKMQYGNLSGDDRQALEYLVGFEENHDLFRPDIDLQGLASLGRYLQNIDSTKADAYLSSSFNPSMLDDAAVFNMGFHGTSPDKLALSADAMKRLGFKPIIFDWAGEEEKKDDSYEFRLDSLSSGMLSEIIQNRTQLRFCYASLSDALIHT